MKLDFEYGSGLMSAELPDNTDVFIPGTTVPDPPCLPQDWDTLYNATLESIRHPMGMPSLRELAGPGKSVVFVIPDIVKGGTQATSHRKVSIRACLDELYAAGSTDGKSAEELFRADYKQFHIAEQNIGVSQITCVDADHLLRRRGEFLALMTKLKEKQEFDMVILMITDVLQEGSHIFYVGSDDIVRQAFNKEPRDNYLFLEGVMSRKKQIIPMLTALWG